MAKSHHQLYSILSACAGNWRNCVYISAGGPDYLLSTSRDGQPIAMTVEQFQQLTGVQIDPTECCGQLTEAGFESLYAQYLLWRCPTAEGHPLRWLCEETSNT